jgi:signal transduction histidine kinase
MFDNLNLRNKILAAMTVPVYALVITALVSAAVSGDIVPVAVAMVGLAVTVGTAYLLAFLMTRRVTALVRAVEVVTTDHLPAILSALEDPNGDPRATADALATEALRSAGLRPDSDPPPALPARLVAALLEDDLTNLLRSIVGSGPAVAELLAGHDATTTKRLGELVRNLARRHQSLLDRQVEHVDWLEDTEQNPERLEQLFKLDHLATRLRRSSETVLVLAGGEVTRPRGGPAPIATVLRAAMGETEAYTKIRLRSVHDCMITGSPAFDLAHLLSELLENASQFSPPETPVELFATRLTDGRYQITIIDRGVGMDEAKLEAANEILANPPDLTLTTGRSIGFHVIGRLAGRIGATVHLAPTPGSGVTATVLVPAMHVIGDPGTVPVPSAQGAATPSAALAAPPAGPSAQPPPPTRRDLLSTKPAEPMGGAQGRSGATAPPPDTKVNPDSSKALTKLLGISTEAGALEASNEWEAPVPAPGTGGPLRSRASADMPVPSSLLGPSDRSSTPDEEQGIVASGHDHPPALSFLEDAIPSGTAFESGIEGLLTPDGPPASAGSFRPENLAGPGEPEGPGMAAETAPVPAPPERPIADYPAPIERSGGDNEPLPSGEATDLVQRSRVDQFDQDVWTPPPVPADAEHALQRRERGASNIPISTGPRVTASARKPEEIRSMITRYRDGLRKTQPTPPEGDPGTDSPAGTDAADDNGKERP